MITWRGMQQADLDQVVDLILTIEAARGSSMMPPREMLKQQLASVGDLMLQNSIVGWHDQRLVAGAGLMPIVGTNPAVAEFQGLVDPEYLRQGLGGKLTEWAVERARAQGLRLRQSVNGENPGQTALCQQYGFQPERYWFRMRKDDVATVQAPLLPDGYRLGRATLENIRAARDVSNRAFAGQWSPASAEFSQAMFERNLASGQVHPERWLTLENAAGEMVAVCCVYAGESERDRHQGFLFNLSVLPAARGAGLGRLMLEAGLYALKEQGCQQAELDVDSGNPFPVLGLYERAGFRTIYTRTYWLFAG